MNRSMDRMLAHELASPIAKAKTICKLAAEDTNEPSTRQSFQEVIKLLEMLEEKIDENLNG